MSAAGPELDTRALGLDALPELHGVELQHDVQHVPAPEIQLGRAVDVSDLHQWRSESGFVVANSRAPGTDSRASSCVQKPSGKRVASSTYGPNGDASCRGSNTFRSIVCNDLPQTMIRPDRPAVATAITNSSSEAIVFPHGDLAGAVVGIAWSVAEELGG
ncbi:hypothetical protein [Streptomyces sp. TRM68367]|uniref:hypothetical protein n=1 Tax=Streptomyces sp. TRM68367 TaxID=2758415 RepID=UPI00165BA00B|nr:hypothetical protein [Streptomyces sp. TRM68367]MBC9729882.1 hypothetical protein [Streptomyces sp. TRM68367]